MTFFLLLAVGGRHKRNGSYGEVSSEDPQADASSGSAKGAKKQQQQQQQQQQNSKVGEGHTAVAVGRGTGTRGSKVTNNEKTMLLSSDDEFQ